DGRLAVFMRLACADLADEDLVAVVSYLRTLPPKKHAVPADEWGVAAKALSSLFDPKPTPALTWVPAGGVSAERGAYLANGPAFCVDCHTPRDPMRGFAPKGPLFSGEDQGQPEHGDPSFELVAPNLTPDPETGHMTTWSEDGFVARLRGGRAFPESTMPWENFARMTEDDLRSIYRYLRTVAPARHDVGPIRRPTGWKPPA
ncbi:MAG: cytochrome c, partial [Archangium sp.]|nr:cytochrome c [Archangium sp.]